jgi:hypothetical protein
MPPLSKKYVVFDTGSKSMPNTSETQFPAVAAGTIDK